MTAKLRKVKVDVFLTLILTQEATVYLDTGATASLIHPHLVHTNCIVPYHKIFSSIDGSRVIPKGEIKNLRFILAGQYFFHYFIILDFGTRMLLGFDFFEKYMPISFTKNSFQLSVKGSLLSYLYFSVNNHLTVIRKVVQNKILILPLEQRKESAQKHIEKRKNEIDQLIVFIEKNYCSEDPQAFWIKNYYEVSLLLKDENMKVLMKANYIAMSAEDRKIVQKEIKKLLKKLIRKSSSS